MDIRRLHDFAVTKRKYFETAPSGTFAWNSSLSLSEFPSGCCGDTSLMLAEELYAIYGISVLYVDGSNGGWNKELGSHAWLEVDGVVIDITADQFNDRGYNRPEVYVRYRDDWYETFEIDKQSTRLIEPT